MAFLMPAMVLSTVLSGYLIDGQSCSSSSRDWKIEFIHKTYSHDSGCRFDGIIIGHVLAPSSAATKGSDKITLLPPSGRRSHLPPEASGAKRRGVERSKARKRSMVCLKGLASSALYLMKKARQFQKWHVSDEYVNAAEGVEPYFSIPVVA
ncbi:uncharacterized protein A4U43_C10F450 [Asparagus officinalis]|uniref:Uncharacterized protein n=1 Tax=Asparagus officinalis TaxID=4686 RepID=A0A5P1DZK1_ASPOF|nr:uncharacterized protein A4U43_C10F450 [Asparagus officinalis]